jgi:hypothetical protein
MGMPRSSLITMLPSGDLGDRHAPIRHHWDAGARAWRKSRREMMRWLDGETYPVIAAISVKPRVGKIDALPPPG